MRRAFGASLPAVMVAVGVTVVAIEKPTKEYQEIMQSNGAIVDISLGTTRSSTGDQPAGGTSLRGHIRAKDYDGIVKDAATLKANFAKVETFWTERKIDDAIDFSKAAIKAATDLETAAKTKDDAAIAAAQTAILATCRGCHQAHRLMVLVDRTFQIM